VFEIVDGVPEFNDSALAVVCPCFSLVFPGESLYTNVLLRLIVAGTDGARTRDLCRDRMARPTQSIARVRAPIPVAGLPGSLEHRNVPIW
jgi:hypothetical protein